MELSKQAYELCRRKDAPALRTLLEAQSADMDLLRYEESMGDPHSNSSWNFNIMGLAATYESPACLQALLDFGADVNNRERRFGWTPLMESSGAGRLECTQLLLENNADVGITDRKGYSALHIAAVRSHPDCLKALIEADADVNQRGKDGYTGVYWACRQGNVECLRVLVENKAHVDCKNVHDNTGLIWAAINGHLECVKVMVEAKADVNLGGSNGDTALTHAFAKSRFDCLTVLLDHDGGDGTPASAKTKAQALGAVLKSEGEFPAQRKRFEQAAAFMLLAHGADISAAAEGVSNNTRLLSAASTYGITHSFIEKWQGVALNTLSTRVEVDKRVGLGLNGLYQEPLERVLQYLGLSMAADLVVNNSLDDDDGALRVLLPNCAHNANHWFQLYQQRKERLAASRANPQPNP